MFMALCLRAPCGTVETTIRDVALAVQSALDTIAAIGAICTFGAFDSFRALCPLPIGVGILSQRCAAKYRQRQHAACYQMSVSHSVLLEARQCSTGKTHCGDFG